MRDRLSAEPDREEPLDQQQAELLARLRAAGGKPVSFDELRSLGIENPATLCYEFDLAGVPVARVRNEEASGPTAALERMHIDNQRATVQKQLSVAKAGTDAGGTATP